MAKTKVKISWDGKFNFEYEGDHDPRFAPHRAINQAFGSLIDAQTQVIDVTPRQEERPLALAVPALPSPPARRRHSRRTGTTPHGDAIQQPVEAAGKAATATLPRTRRTRSHSFCGQVYTLLREGYFAKLRTANDIRHELGRRGHNFDPKDVASYLLWLVQKEYLVRQKNDKRVYAYGKGSNNELPRG